MKECDVPYFGSAEYIRSLGPLKSVREIGKRTKMYAELKGKVTDSGTPKDKLRIYAAFECGLEDGEKFEIVHVCAGLNGGGRQKDYFSAISRLITRNKTWTVVASCVDSPDDLMDFLVVTR